MQTMTRVVTILSIAMSLGIAMPAFAESAPVYDADTMPSQQFDNGQDQAQDMPPPPPSSSQDGTFVPVQQQQQAVTIDNTPSSMPVSGPSMSMDQRLRRMEQQVSNLSNNDAAARVDALQAQIQTLRGQLEQLIHQMAQIQSQQKSMYADLDKRLAQKPVVVSKSLNRGEPDISNTQNVGSVEDASVIPVATTKSSRKALAAKSAASRLAKPVAVNPDAPDASDTIPATSSNASSSQPNVAEEQQIYQTAYNLIKAKKYSDAVSALNGMLKKYPSGQFAANAHYWLGELYGLMTKNDQALTEFSTVVKTYPDSPRVSDAQLKVGMILAAQFKWVDAKSAFKKVINHYPGTSSARLAMEQLKQIKQAGH